MGKTPRSATFDSQINTYLMGKEPHLTDVTEALLELMARVVPSAQRTLNAWGIPTYDLSGELCYVDVTKKHVTLGFLRGTSLPDPDGLLEGTGKNLRHVKLRTVTDVNRRALTVLIKAAVKLNRDASKQS